MLTSITNYVALQRLLKLMYFNVFYVCCMFVCEYIGSVTLNK